MSLPINSSEPNLSPYVAYPSPYTTYSFATSLNHNNCASTPETPSISTSEMSALRKCSRCRRYVPSAEFLLPQKCTYHRGNFKLSDAPPVPHRFGLSSKWSCCGSDDPKQTGCTKGYHQEDRTTSAILDKYFPVQSIEPIQNGSPSNSLNTNQTTPSFFDSAQKERSLEEDASIHHVKSTDTLAGIALRYNVRMQDLKRWNNLLDDSSLKFRDVIYIQNQQNGEEKGKGQKEKSPLIQKFATEAFCHPLEASYYLEEAGWQFDRAMSAFQENKHQFYCTNTKQ